MSTNGTTWIVSPCYFDVPAWRRLRSELGSQLAERDIRHRFVLVDDSAGADPDLQSVSDEDALVMSPPFNIGHQRALTFGLRRLLDRLADDDVVVTLDADGEDRPSDVALLLESLEADRFQICLARRTKRAERLGFRVAYLLFRVLFRVMTGRSMRTGNFAAYSARSARRILAQPQFDLSYSSALTVSGAQLTLVDCARGERYAGQPKMNREKLVSHGLRSLMPFQEQIAIRALCASGLVVVLGVVTLIVIAGVRFATNTAVPGWATYSSLMIIAISSVALSNFVVMFAIFSQSRSVALAGLERDFE